MCHKVLALLFTAIAIIIAILAVLLPPENIDAIVVISRFFEVMIPILAVGALFKYLFSCWHHNDNEHHHHHHD